MELISILAIVFALLFIYHKHKCIQFGYRKLPPGPILAPLGLGIIPGALYYIFTECYGNFSHFKPWIYLDTLGKKYGEIFSIQLGGMYTVVFSSYEILLEASNMEEYSYKFAHERCTYPRTFGKELGLIFANKPELWIEMRKFTQRTLRDFGFGKQHTMQSVIEAETTQLVTDFKEVINTNGGLVKVRSNFSLYVFNVLWCMVAGTRYEHGDPQLTKVMERNIAMTKTVTFAQMATTMVVLRDVRKLFPRVFFEDLRQQVFDECHEFSKALVDERRAEGMYKENPQNYIDVFLQKLDEHKDNPNTLYTEEQLLAMMEDLLQTGVVTTTGTLNYAILFFILNPDIQIKCQKEIDSIVPRHLSPTLDDIKKMHYFQACVLETHRLANVVPNPIPRIVPKDWRFKGYVIPKGAIILSNHYSVHMNEDNFADPHKFKPERFINEQGDFFMDKRVIHYGFGRRQCVGTALANSVIPIFLGVLLQNFNFSLVPGTPAPTTEPEIGVSLSPVEYVMMVSNRA